MNKTQKILIIVSITLAITWMIIIQTEIKKKLDLRTETQRIEQEKLLQEKYDEGYLSGITQQFTDDEKVIMGRNSIFNEIVARLDKDGEVSLNTDEGIKILIEKISE